MTDYPESFFEEKTVVEAIKTILTDFEQEVMETRLGINRPSLPLIELLQTYNLSYSQFMEIEGKLVRYLYSTTSEP